MSTQSKECGELPLSHFEKSARPSCARKSLVTRTSKCSMVNSIEAIVIGDGNVSIGVQKNGQHIVSFLANRVVKRGITLPILETGVAAQFQQCLDHGNVT